MNYCFILSLVSAVLLTSGSCFTIKQDTPDVKQPIIGGEISREIIPYHVSLKCDGVNFGGGALISPQHVLTAGHCIAYIKDKNCVVKVYAGSNVVNGGEVIEGESTSLHPEYSIYTLEHDIGVIKLKSPFTLSEKIQTIGLASTPPVNGEVITITGYGRMNRTNNDFSEVLRKYTSGVLTFEKCYELDGRHVFPSDFCDSGQENFGPCEADSGSPVVNGRSVMGVVSKGLSSSSPRDPVQDCASGYPNIFASVYHHLDFIKACLSQ